MKLHFLHKQRIIPKDSQLAEIVDGLREIGLNREQKKDLVKNCCNCLCRLFGFEEELYKGIGYAIAHNLQGNEAYDYLTKDIINYDKEETKKMQPFLDSLTNPNRNNFIF